MKKSLAVKFAAAFAVAALSLTGINVSAANAAGGNKIYVLGGGDAFFAVVKNGFNAAALAVKDGGDTPIWLGLQNYDNIGPDMVKLIQTAVAQGADAIALPIWDAAAEGPEIQKAVAKGIKVIAYNAGEPVMKKYGASAYIGTNEYTAGVKAGEYLASQGKKNAICVNDQPASANIKQRCDGLAKGEKNKGGKSTQLSLPATAFANATAIANAVKGAITKDKTINAVFTISSADCDASVVGVKAAGSKAAIGSFDLSENILNRVKNGEQLVAVDQQGWLQGFLATSTAWQFAAYGILPATTTILTGPALITKDNAAKVIAGVKTGQR